MRKRHYVGKQWLTLVGPAFRYSYSRDAYVLRGVGKSVGPVLREDRRRSLGRASDGIERRRTSVA